MRERMISFSLAIISLIIIYVYFFDNSIEKALYEARNENFKRAKTIILPIAESGDSLAQYICAYVFLDLLNEIEFEKWMKLSAKNNYINAQYDLGMYYSKGWFTRPIEDINKAIYWFERAGFNGAMKAYANLGLLYDDESAEIENRRKVLSEIHQLAKDGNALAQYNMGWIYARGLLTNSGLMQNIESSEYWFRQSAKNGNIDAKAILKERFGLKNLPTIYM